MNIPTRCSFQRTEKKYFLTPRQRDALLAHMQLHMRADDYGSYTICNIYYDTPDWRLVRASIERPAYKEKLRVRSYGVPQEQSQVFVELKKKLEGVVYKRRVSMEACMTQPFLDGIAPEAKTGQIAQEILWFQRFYRAEPRVFLAYDRTAFAGMDEPELRVTFDRSIRWRTDALDLCLGDRGERLLRDDRILMEVKLPGVCPLWLSRALSEIGAYPTTFSKYGFCYQTRLLPEEIQNTKEARYSA